MAFEVFIEGKVEVKPLAVNGFSKETITLLAEVYQTFIAWYWVKGNNENLQDVAVRYFENKGFQIRERERERERESSDTASLQSL